MLTVQPEMGNMDVAIIGNCQYSALTDSTASVTWMCWPRFDSSPVFGKLLDRSGGSFDIACPDPAQIDQRYLRNTNVLRTTFTSARGSFDVTDLAPRFVLHNRIFNPTMLVRIVRPLSGEPSVCVTLDPTY